MLKSVVHRLGLARSCCARIRFSHEPSWTVCIYTLKRPRLQSRGRTGREAGRTRSRLPNAISRVGTDAIVPLAFKACGPAKSRSLAAKRVEGTALFLLLQNAFRIGQAGRLTTATLKRGTCPHLLLYALEFLQFIDFRQIAPQSSFALTEGLLRKNPATPLFRSPITLLRASSFHFGGHGRGRSIRESLRNACTAVWGT